MDLPVDDDGGILLAIRNGDVGINVAIYGTFARHSDVNVSFSTQELCWSFGVGMSRHEAPGFQGMSTTVCPSIDLLCVRAETKTRRTRVSLPWTVPKNRRSAESDITEDGLENGRGLTHETYVDQSCSQAE